MQRKEENNMSKTTATCPKCGKGIAHLNQSYIVTREVTLRYPKGDNYVLGEYLDFGEPETDAGSRYYQCPLCKKAVCASDEWALEFLKGE